MQITIRHDPQAFGFRLVLDGEERLIGELAGEPLREWHQRYAADKLAGFQLIREALDDRDFLAAMAADAATVDALIDALLAYDRRSVLRGRDWIERNLTTEQVVLILQRIQAAHA